MKYITERFSIPSNMCGVVLGKKGEIINVLKATIGVDMYLDDRVRNDSNDVVICGEPDKVNEAKRAIEKALQDAGMLIPASKCTLVLGQGGKTLKALQENFSVRMWFLGEVKDDPRKLKIEGRPEKIMEAQRAIEQLLRGVVMMVPSNKCGLIMGKSGVTMKNMQNTIGVRMSLDNKSTSDQQKLSIFGLPDDIEKAKSAVEKLVKVPLKRLSHSNDSVPVESFDSKKNVETSGSNSVPLGKRRDNQSDSNSRDHSSRDRSSRSRHSIDHSSRRSLSPPKKRRSTRHSTRSPPKKRREESSRSTRREESSRSTRHEESSRSTRHEESSRSTRHEESSRSTRHEESSRKRRHSSESEKKVEKKREKKIEKKDEKREKKIEKTEKKIEKTEKKIEKTEKKDAKKDEKRDKKIDSNEKDFAEKRRRTQSPKKVEKKTESSDKKRRLLQSDDDQMGRNGINVDAIADSQIQPPINQLDLPIADSPTQPIMEVPISQTQPTINELEVSIVADSQTLPINELEAPITVSQTLPNEMEVSIAESPTQPPINELEIVADSQTPTINELEVTESPIIPPINELEVSIAVQPASVIDLIAVSPTQPPINELQVPIAGQPVDKFELLLGILCAIQLVGNGILQSPFNQPTILEDSIAPTQPPTIADEKPITAIEPAVIVAPTAKPNVEKSVNSPTQQPDQSFQPSIKNSPIAAHSIKKPAAKKSTSKKSAKKSKSKSTRPAVQLDPGIVIEKTGEGKRATRQIPNPKLAATIDEAKLKLQTALVDERLKRFRNGKLDKEIEGMLDQKIAERDDDYEFGHLYGILHKEACEQAESTGGQLVAMLYSGICQRPLSERRKEHFGDGGKFNDEEYEMIEIKRFNQEDVKNSTLHSMRALLVAGEHSVHALKDEFLPNLISKAGDSNIRTPEDVFKFAHTIEEYRKALNQVIAALEEANFVE